jgi:hypothetical protein
VFHGIGAEPLQQCRTIAHRALVGQGYQVVHVEVPAPGEVLTDAEIRNGYRSPLGAQTGEPISGGLLGPYP